MEEGRICVLLGPSGSGKSTLLNIIGGIETAEQGYIAINGEKIADTEGKASSHCTGEVSLRICVPVF